MSDHEHQYTIPVEWEYDYKEITDINKLVKVAADLKVWPQYQVKRVIKLLCVCGEEIDR